MRPTHIAVVVALFTLGIQLAADDARAWGGTFCWAEKIEEYPVDGKMITLVDNSATIDAQLAKWNAAQGWPWDGPRATPEAAAPRLPRRTRRLRSPAGAVPRTGEVLGVRGSCCCPAG